jgi:hypothetical protein
MGNTFDARKIRRNIDDFALLRETKSGEKCLGRNKWALQMTVTSIALGVNCPANSPQGLL